MVSWFDALTGVAFHDILGDKGCHARTPIKLADKFDCCSVSRMFSRDRVVTETYDLFPEGWNL